MDKIFHYEKLIIILISIITIFFAFQIPDLNINNDLKVFLPDDNPSKQTYNQIEAIFGGNNRMIVALDLKNGTIFTAENISLIDQLTNQFSKIPGVAEATSLTNADYIAGTSEGMVVEKLVQEIPENHEGLAALKSKLLSWDFYRNNLFNKDFKATQILIDLEDDLSNPEKDQIYYQIEDISQTYNNNNLDIYIAGASAVNVLMGDSMIQDITHLIPFVIILLILALIFFFRRVMPVVLTMITVLVSSIWSIGLMALVGINMTIVSTVIPVLLIAVGSAYGIHILSHYYDNLAAENKKLSTERHREIVLKTIRNMGKPVFLAGLTTVVGFGSLATSQIVPIKSFGIFTAVGIATAFLVAIFLIPALLLVRFQQTNQVSGYKDKIDTTIESLIINLHKFYASKRISIILFTVIFIVISLIGMSKIVIDTPLIEMFKKDTDVRQADKFINHNFAGTSLMNILIEGEGKGSLTDPEILKQMDNLEKYLTDSLPVVGKSLAITNFIKRMNRVMHYPEATDKNDSQANSTVMEKETTSSFYSTSETTNSGKEETTSNFYSEESNNQTEETASSFYNNDQKNGSAGNGKDTQQKEISAGGPKRDSSISEFEFVKLINAALIRADKLDFTGEELVRLINQKTNFRGAAYNEIPYELSKYPAEDKNGLKNLISQYLLLYSGSLGDFINDQLEPDKAQMILQLNSPSNIVAANVEEKIKDFSKNNFPAGYSLRISGYSDLGLEANNLIIHSQTMSILVSFIIVFLILAISYKSLIAGIYGIIPLAFSLLINFGLMGYAGIKLDVGTAMVASLAIGIGVDYTIHFLDGYKKERQKSAVLHQVTRETLTTTGKAIIFNAVSVAGGFIVLMFSNFYPLVYLGLLITVTMLTSSLAALTILPILLNIFKPTFISK